MDNNAQRIVAVSSLRKAEERHGWAAIYRTPTQTGEVNELTGYAPILHRGSFRVVKTVNESVNPKGLGAVRLYSAEVPVGRFEPDALAHYVADSTCLGSAAFIDRRYMMQLFESLPVRFDVASEARELELRLLALDAIYSGSYLYFRSYQRNPDFSYKLILPKDRVEQYGLLWVPKSQAELLATAETEEIPGDIADSHVFVDVLATKHRLMSDLGLAESIAMDNARIRQWQEYQRRGEGR